MNEFFFDVFINHLLKNHRSVVLKITVDLLYFWDIYDVNLWEKLAITVRLCFVETRLKQGYDLRGCFLNLTREMINILTIAIFHYLSKWTFFSSSRREMFCKKGVLKFSQNLRTPFETLRLCCRCLNFVILLKFVSAIF